MKTDDDREQNYRRPAKRYHFCVLRKSKGHPRIPGVDGGRHLKQYGVGAVVMPGEEELARVRVAVFRITKAALRPAAAADVDAVSSAYLQEQHDAQPDGQRDTSTTCVMSHRRRDRSSSKDCCNRHSRQHPFNQRAERTQGAYT